MVGSTAFKSGATSTKEAINRFWVKQINHFYLDFPENFRRHYAVKSPAAHDDAYRDLCPRLWKTLGDELILCGRIACHEHLAVVVSSFARALKDYGYYLDERDVRLDVKGSAWVAPFPEPNITIRSVGARGDATQEAASDEIPDEAFEADADLNPSGFDFLGRHVDTGFRVSRHARTDFLPMSVELALLLAEVSRRDIEQFKFVYEGRSVLHGVLGDRPYPLFGLDMERSERRRAIRARERSLASRVDAKVDDIWDFLRLFMEDEGIEAPVLSRDGRDVTPPQLPASYVEFASMWAAEEEANANSVGPDDVGVDDDAATDEVSAELAEAAQAIVGRTGGQDADVGHPSPASNP